MKTTHEIVIFKFKPGLSLSEQTKLLNSLNGCASKYEGFIRRKFFYSSEQESWVDHITWKDLTCAKNASKQIMENPDALNVIQHIDESQMSFSHYEEMS